MPDAHSKLDTCERWLAEGPAAKPGRAVHTRRAAGVARTPAVALVSLLALALCAVMLLPASASALANGTIEGKVESGGKALVGFRVCAYLVGGGEGKGCENTNSSGDYTISLAPGKYKVEFTNENCSGVCETENYVTQFYSDKRTFTEAGEVEVKAATPTTGISAVLAAGGKIEGTVTAETGGAPLVGLYVCIEAKTEPFFNACIQTKTGGKYAVVGLAGEYTVYFTNFYCTEDEAECESENFIPQYWHDQPGFSTSEAVKVAAGETKEKIDAALATGGKIEGEVTVAPSGAPAANIEVCAEARGEPFYESCGLTNTKGEYTLVGLGSAQYVVEFYAGAPYVEEWYDEKFEAATANLVTVTAPGTMSGINARLVGSEKQYLEEVAAAKQHELEVAAAAAAKKHAEELAAAKKREEEAIATAAATKKHEEEVAAAKRHEEEAAASVKLEKVKVTAKDLVLTIKTSEKGTVTVTGPGLKKTVETLTAGTHVVKVPLTKTGKADRALHKKIKLAVSLKVDSRTVSSSKKIEL